MSNYLTMTHMYILVVLRAMVTFTSAHRDPLYESSGSAECVPLERYLNVLQYATCLTDTYIRIKSGENQQCVDHLGTYCWYHCMCEFNNECEGSDVYGSCSSDTNSPARPTTLFSQTMLPPWCFIPSGQQCSWYGDCLEKRYPCEGTDAAYAITYANKFCDLFSDHYQEFSNDGQRWIDAVRKCLQVELVPILRPWISASCVDIKGMAFTSHTKCYTSPASGVSYCTLSWIDKWKVFWTIKGAFTSAFVESVKGAWDTLSECITGNHDERVR